MGAQQIMQLGDVVLCWQQHGDVAGRDCPALDVVAMRLQQGGDLPGAETECVAAALVNGALAFLALVLNDQWLETGLALKCVFGVVPEGLHLQVANGVVFVGAQH